MKNLNKSDLFFCLWCAAILFFLLMRPQPKPSPQPQIHTVNSIPISRRQEIGIGECEMLARLIESEANNQEMPGKIAVANVVQNRANLNGTTLITEILSIGQFSGTYNKSFRGKISHESRKAALLALTGSSVLPEHFIYYLNPHTASDKKMLQMSRSNESIKIGSHVFFSPFKEW